MIFIDMKRIALLLLASVFCDLSSMFSQMNFVQHVDPMIGTGGHGHTFPGATLPFGMVQLSPDTRIDGSWDGCSGYHYSDSVIYGFSHTHLSGTGCSDYGDIAILPFTDYKNDDKAKPESFNYRNYAQKFSHKDEKASAGYYSVKLENGIKTELTSTTRVGFHRYVFPSGKKAHVVIQLDHRDKTIESDIKVVNNKRLEGFRRSEAWAKDQHIYFVIEFSDTFVEDGMMGSESSKAGESKVFFQRLLFDKLVGKPLLVKVGISNVSIEGAGKNLEAELSHWDFEKTRKDAVFTWNKELSKIEVTDPDKDKMKIFYSALYHTMIQPNINMDVDGMYRGRDNKIHKAEGFTYYSVFSLWDTFRAAHPLYTIIDRQRTSDFINTFLAQYEQGGRLPVWELASNETDCMIGYHSVSVIADAMVKGIKGFDYEKAYAASKHSAMLDHLGLDSYKRNGFISMDDEHESVSKTLEYAYDDWCIAQMAKLLNKQEDYSYFIGRSQSWKNVFDKQSGFMRPKKNGGWLFPFEPREVNNNFTEGNSWQYTFFVPQDISGLITMMGGKEKFERKLDELFSASSKTTGREQVDITGLIGQYAHGNEPSHHMAYLYNFVDKPHKAQFRINQIMKDFYKLTPDGLIGNEDCGQMSAWYVLNAIGLYSVIPGGGKFELGTPAFNNVKIYLAGERVFEIEADDFIESNYYVQSYLLNSTPFRQTFIDYDVISRGGKFSFQMSAFPSTYIFDKTVSLPILAKNLVIPVPFISAGSRVFDDSLLITIGSENKKDKIFYSCIDNEKKESFFLAYVKPFKIGTSQQVFVYCENQGLNSDTISGTFFKRPNNWKIKIASKYNPQYTAGGDEGIIDGLHGTENWRKGDWQGYQPQNFEAVIDLLKEQKISSVSSTYLQDTRAWIIYPLRVKYSFSKDGVNFGNEIIVENNVAANDYEVRIRDFSQTLSQKLEARYIKVEAVNFGKLPEWHQGSGGDAFIFIDEIEIK
jgi:predicted alpha-1,2-mannosidase